MTLDYVKLGEMVDPAARFNYVEGVFKDLSQKTLPYLTDAIVNARGPAGVTVLRVLGEMETTALGMSRPPLQWTLRAVRDEWGNELAPGDIVERRIPINRKNRKGQPVRASEMNIALTDGSFAERFEAVKAFPVDSKGCIKCNFSDASYFLSQFGFHGRTKRGITSYPMKTAEPVTVKNEISDGPTKAPNGTLLHVWYWRFFEVDEDMYKALPTLKAAAATTKRGQVDPPAPPPENK